MFEYQNEGRDDAKIIVWCIVIPLSVFYAFHRSLFSAFLLQVSVASILCFVFGLEIHKQRANLSKSWSIKSTLITICLIHPLFLVIAWQLDATYPVLITGAGSIFVTGFVVGVIEMIVAGEITKRFRSLDADEG